MSQLYSSPPDVGLLIFDPEGEYALPDTHGRPGLVNVPDLRKKISLYTNRTVERQYPDVVRGTVFTDFGDFPPQDIVAAFVAQEKQDSVFANLVRSMDWKLWKQLVALLAERGFATEDQKLPACFLTSSTRMMSVWPPTRTTSFRPSGGCIAPAQPWARTCWRN